MNFVSAATLALNGGLPLARPTQMTTTETCRYRGYDIVPNRQWSQWCVSVYATRADLPLFSRSTLCTLALGKEEAVAEAKQRIDRLLHSWVVRNEAASGVFAGAVSFSVIRRGSVPPLGLLKSHVQIEQKSGPPWRG